MADIQWVERDQWDARPPRNQLAAMPAGVDGVKAHYTGGAENKNMGTGTGHALCVARVKSIQNSHMDGNGWSDVGYSYLVCAHGKVFVGRGFGKLPAANGPGLNSDHYAVCALVGNSGLTKPSDAMLCAIRDVIDYLRGRGVGKEIKGHRNGYATDCPGGPLYAWVTKGAPRPAGTVQAAPKPAPKPTAPKPAPQTTTTKPVAPAGEGDMDHYTSLALLQNVGPIPADTPADVLWDTEYSDPSKSHVDAGANASFLNGPAKYTVDLEVVLYGLLPGDVVYTRLVEVKAATVPAVVAESTRWRPATVVVNEDGSALITHSGIGAVSEGRKLRLQIMHDASDTSQVTILQGSARMRSTPA